MVTETQDQVPQTPEGERFRPGKPEPAGFSPLLWLSHANATSPGPASPRGSNGLLGAAMLLGTLSQGHGMCRAYIGVFFSPVMGSLVRS